MFKEVRWAGNIPFRDPKEITHYKRVLLEYHFSAQKERCLYCNKVCLLKEKGCTRSPSKDHATIEHLEPVWMTKKKWKMENPDLIRWWGDLSIENTAMACQLCNNSRPFDMSVEMWRKKRSNANHIH